jgi:hypothetical protein
LTVPFDVLGRPAVTGRVGKVRAVVGEHGVYLVRHRGGESAKEVTGYSPGRLLVQLDEGKLGCPVDRNEQVELTLLGANLGDINVEVADRIALELGADGRVALDRWKPGDAVALQTAV